MRAQGVGRGVGVRAGVQPDLAEVVAQPAFQIRTHPVGQRLPGGAGFGEQCADAGRRHDGIAPGAGGDRGLHTACDGVGLRLGRAVGRCDAQILRTGGHGPQRPRDSPVAHHGLQAQSVADIVGMGSVATDRSQRRHQPVGRAVADLLLQTEEFRMRIGGTGCRGSSAAAPLARRRAPARSCCVGRSRSRSDHRWFSGGSAPGPGTTLPILRYSCSTAESRCVMVIGLSAAAARKAARSVALLMLPPGNG